MFSFRKTVVMAALLATATLAVAQGDKYPGVGRNATPKEVAAWDIDVRPDFKGLPKGSGSVAQGQDIWEAKCASCHGVFGESNEVFSPVIGGTTAEDIKTGHVANLRGNNYPGRTTVMKVATVSTLWDFINRAMPWNNPKTLKPDEVYAVLAFYLNMANIVPENFVLSDQNIAEVQKRMPNRNGMTLNHGMWPDNATMKTAGKPDTANKACMKDCVPEPKLASMLPDFARNAHGNLAEQVRMVGQARGADTTKPESKGAPAAVAPVVPKATQGGAGKQAIALLNKYTCTACHGIDSKIVGPAYTEVAKKHAGNADYLLTKIKAGGVGVWGQIPMPAQTIPDADAKIIAQWLAQGAKK
jgi:cytochrome c551/c552